MKNIAQKLSIGVLLAAAMILTPSAANAASVSDDAGFFDSSDKLQSQLEVLEAERGLEILVETLPESEAEVNVTDKADGLRADNENVIAVVLEAGSDKLGVSYGERVTHVISSETLEKIVDKEMIPLLQEGEYDESVTQLVKSVNLLMGLETADARPAEPGINGWFAENKLPLAVAAAAFMLFLAFSFFFITKLSAKKSEDLSDALAAEKVRRLKEVSSFWDFTNNSIKERFVSAPNRVEREKIVSEVFDKQSFVDDNSRLTNIIGSFLYPGKVQENFSIQHFIDFEERAEKNRVETVQMWDALDADQKDAFRSASSESHQEALVGKFFPDMNPVEMVSRLRVMVPDSKSVDPDYSTYVDEKLAKAEAERAPAKKSRLFGFIGR